MTDDEAVEILCCLHNAQCPVVSSDRRKAAVAHALAAISDRAAMVAVEGAAMPTAPLRLAADAARRHMRGEP